MTEELCELCEVPLTEGSWGGYCHDCDNQAGLCEDCGMVLDEDRNCEWCQEYEEVPCPTCRQPSRGVDECSHCEEMRSVGLLDDYLAVKVACVGCGVFMGESK